VAGLVKDGPTGSCLGELEGSRSGAHYAADRVMTTDPSDGRPLFARYRIPDVKRQLTRDALASRRTDRLWRWRELLPV